MTGNGTQPNSRSVYWPFEPPIAAPDFSQKAYRRIKISHSLTAAVTPEKAWHRAGGRCASDKRLAVALTLPVAMKEL
jgi:hypothetical protein